MHSNFFSSLKRVEKRLKLDHKSPISHSISALPPQSQPQPQPQPQPLENTSNSMESLSSPIILYNASDSHHPSKTSNLEDSEIPLEFLSNSLDFPSTHEESSPEKPLVKPPKTLEQEEEEEEDVDEIESLIELLNLSTADENESNYLELDSCCSCHCDDGFFGKIVGVKGPKCRKEMERLNGWIDYFRKEKMEPLRLAHLLIGKAAFVHSRSISNGCVELQFPSTIEEFLRHDPPLV